MLYFPNWLNLGALQHFLEAIHNYLLQCNYRLFFLGGDKGPMRRMG